MPAPRWNHLSCSFMFALWAEGLFSRAMKRWTGSLLAHSSMPLAISCTCAWHDTRSVMCITAMHITLQAALHTTNSATYDCICLVCRLPSTASRGRCAPATAATAAAATTAAAAAAAAVVSHWACACDVQAVGHGRPSQYRRAGHKRGGGSSHQVFQCWRIFQVSSCGVGCCVLHV